ncbi:phage scaffolding protein [Helcococcus ovis]|uniref:phage scaffolding protein n=1 Tax=Helcococcus ovis TaxID=72026 RepID=UPI0038BB33EB
MNRTFLKGLGLEQEAIEAIMAEYGTDVNGLKDKVGKLEEDKKSLEDSLKSFEGVDIKKLQEDNENLKNTYENQIKDIKISNAIEKALSGANAKHSDLLIGKFDKEEIKITKDGNIEGIDKLLKSFLFSSG